MTDRKARRDQRRYVLTNHLCRFCGTGRILQQINSGPTGGGNPVYFCSTCERASAAMGPDCLCWCNHIADRGGLPYETQCFVGEPDAETIQRGWRRRRKHYGLSVLWRYAPEYTADTPDHERAERFLATGDL